MILPVYLVKSSLVFVLKNFKSKRVHYVVHTCFPGTSRISSKISGACQSKSYKGGLVDRYFDFRLPKAFATSRVSNLDNRFLKKGPRFTFSTSTMIG